MISESTREFSLIQIAAGRPARACKISSLDGMDQMLAQGERRDRDLFEARGFRITGDEIEQLGCIAPERRIGGEQRQIGVNLGGLRMVVAGAEMHIGAKIAAFAAHDQAHLGVCLQFDEAVDDLHARAFQIARPFDVGGFIEAGLEFDQRGNGLACLGRFDQRFHDRGVVRGAIERLLDRNHVGIERGLPQELHHHVEAFERMMDDEILGADGGEAIAAMVADAFGEARDIGLELQIGAFIEDELLEFRQTQHVLRSRVRSMSRSR